MTNKNASSMTKILIFTGAGISKPLNLPVTKDFASIINTSCSSIMQSMKESKSEANYGDIEIVLSLLETITDNNNFWYKWILNKRQYSSFNDVYSSLEKIRNSAKEAETTLKRNIYESLDQFDRKSATNLYYYLIKEIKKIDTQSCISFFTANYDLSFERFEDELDGIGEDLGITEVEYGFPLKRKKQIFDPVICYKWEPEIIEYKKLHGSLDWVMRDGVCVKTGAKTIPNNPYEMPLLYPGFKGTPTSEPFISLHGQFFERMKEADIMIFIGFAFRDPYINNLINIVLGSNNDKAKKVLCYNPASLDDLPEESNLSYFVKQYPKTFVHVQECIEIKENPLNLKSKLAE